MSFLLWLESELEIPSQCLLLFKVVHFKQIEKPKGCQYYIPYSRWLSLLANIKYYARA